MILLIWNRRCLAEMSAHGFVVDHFCPAELLLQLRPEALRPTSSPRSGLIDISSIALSTSETVLTPNEVAVLPHSNALGFLSSELRRQMSRGCTSAKGTSRQCHFKPSSLGKTIKVHLRRQEISRSTTSSLSDPKWLHRMNAPLPQQPVVKGPELRVTVSF